MTNEEVVKSIKLALQEHRYPFFCDDTEILAYYELYGKDLDLTKYEMLKIKAVQGNIAIAGLTLPQTERYFLRLALNYRPNNSKGNNSANGNGRGNGGCSWYV